MNEDDIKELVSGAVDVTEENSAELLPVKRAQMANWLWTRFRIAIKELVVSITDGEPYLKVEYIDNEGKQAETTVSMAKYREKLTAELEKMNEKLKESGV